MLLLFCIELFMCVTVCVWSSVEKVVSAGGRNAAGEGSEPLPVMIMIMFIFVHQLCCST